MYENYTLDISHVANGSVKTVNGYVDASVCECECTTHDGWSLIVAVQVHVNSKAQIVFILCRFDEKENIGNSNIAKSSVQKGIRSQILEQFQHIEDYLDQIMPKKEPLKLVKWLVKFHLIILLIIEVQKTDVILYSFTHVW